MKIKLISTASKRIGAEYLIRSAKSYGWDLELITGNWNGLGCKENWTVEYLKANPEITHFVFTDAFDTFCTGEYNKLADIITRNKWWDKMVISAEKGYYPDTGKRHLYPENLSPFKYVNAGQFFCSSKLFLELMESNPIPNNDINDQLWMTELFFNNPDKCVLDYNCEIFQSVAFSHPEEFKAFPLLIHGNGGTDLTPYKHLAINPNNIDGTWENTEDSHRFFNDVFVSKTNYNPKLKALRDWSEPNIHGFGERAFYSMFECICKPTDTDYLEIGVFKGQTLALLKLINPKANITGITPMDTTGGYWDCDYRKDIQKIHDQFKLPYPTILHGLSSNPDIITEASKKEYDLIYIDGDHSYNGVKQDLLNYSHLVKKGGYLVLDDCSCHYHLPDGMFRGHEETTKSVNDNLDKEMFEELFNLVHIRVFKRK